MQSGEPELHSFIVKIWFDREGNEDNTAQQHWRGYITHVPGGERRYLNHLEEIAEFISPFLPEASSPPLRSIRRLIRTIRRKLG